MKIDNGNFENFEGVTAGVQQEERWQYPGSGYNAEEKADTLEIVPFAMRQCKEVTGANGVTHRYPLKTRKIDMADGDVTTRLQVVGIINDELHIFGARSWTARAAWANPLGGPYHDGRFEGGIWPRLMNHIKDMKSQHGRQTAPLCWQLKLIVGEAIDLTSAATAKQKSKGHPIIAESMAFVGPEKAAEYERLYVDEAINEWVAEWNKPAVAESTTPDTEFRPMPETDELLPF